MCARARLAHVTRAHLVHQRLRLHACGTTSSFLGGLLAFGLEDAFDHVVVENRSGMDGCDDG